MLKELSQYKKPLNDFIIYLKNCNVDINNFFKLDFNYRIGFYIEFLSTKNISINFDSFNYIIYYDKEAIESIEYFKNTRTLTIKESNNNEITNVLFPIENFKLGLVEAFKHLECPF